MGKQLTCPRCFHPVHATDWFCDNCGFPLKRELEDHPQEISEIDTPIQSFPPRSLDPKINPDVKRDKKEKAKHDQVKPKVESFSKKEKLVKPKKKVNDSSRSLNANHHYARNLIAVAIVLVGAYGYGRFHFSKSETLNRELNKPVNASNLLVSNGHPLTKSQKTAVEQQLSSKDNQRKLRATYAIGNEITYQQVGNYWHLFPKYQLVLDVDKLSTKMNKLQTNKKVTKPKPVVKKKTVKKKLTKKQAITATLNNFWSQMNQLTKKGNVKPALADNFVSGSKNATYKELSYMAQKYHRLKYNVEYNYSINSIKGDDDSQVNSVLAYHFDSGKVIHVQKFHWYAKMSKQGNRYLISWMHWDLSPFSDYFKKK